ncbi:MAG: ABC transporter permease [Gemmatimonadaceae bacterium]
MTTQRTTSDEANDTTGGDRTGRFTRASRWEPLWQDIRYAARGLRRSPGFTAAVVLTLGLGLGANATMFGVVDRLLFRAPAYLSEPGRVHRVYLARTFERDGEQSSSNISYKRYLELTTGATTLDRTAAFFGAEMAIGTGDAAREVRVGTVSASFWSLFDARPVIGRFFTPAEDQTPDGTPVAVLGYAYWRANYGGRADVLGKPVTIGAKIYTIIGVAPEGFNGIAPQQPAAFIPITASTGDLFGGRERGGADRPTYYGSHNTSWMEMLVRRKLGVSVEAATADLTSVYRRSYLDQLTTNTGMRPIDLARPHAVVAPVLRERGPNRGQDTKVATWLVGVAAIVLLIACANVGNLLLARAFGRRREIAVRLALGVSRGQLLRQLVTESLLLAALGGLAGLAIAQWGGGLLQALLLQNVDRPSAFGDAHVLVFTTAAALLAGLLTGLAPALFAGRGDVAATLRSGARGGTYHRSRTRTALLIVQAALSVVLLVGAGLFVRSLRNVRTLDLGYDSDRVLFVTLEMRGVTLQGAGGGQLRRRLLERAEALPFVEHATRTVSVPFYMNINQTLIVPGIDSVNRLGDFYYHAVSPGYFATMGTPIRRGRGIADGDRQGGEPVMVVSESMARKLWPGREALGQCVKVGADSMPCSTVVGIAGDIKRGSLTQEEGLQYYVAIEQTTRNGGGLFIRTRGDAPRRAEALRRELQKEMPGVSYVTITPLAEILGSQTRAWSLGATMFTVFGAIALLLAAVGLYGVIAYTVAQRGHEMGVRVALGAQERDVVRLVLGEGLRLTGVGVAIGLLIAFAAGRYVGPLLFDVSPKDPGTFALVTATLLVVALLASGLPARRAARVNPNVALRAE